MRIDRIWAMPNKWTFTIQPIADLLREEITGGVWVDPFAGENSPAKIRNDLNPERNTEYHMDALEFLKMFDKTEMTLDCLSNSQPRVISVHS